MDEIALPPSGGSRKMFWTGWVLSILPSALLLFSAVMKIMRTPMVVDGFAKQGYPPAAALGIGLAELVCTIIYLIPQTAPLGAILLAGYLGGAIDSSVHSGQPIYMPLATAILIWLGLWLREPRLRALLPLRRKA